jgi:hypothetical protein
VFVCLLCAILFFIKIILRVTSKKVNTNSSLGRGGYQYVVRSAQQCTHIINKIPLFVTTAVVGLSWLA